MLIIELAALWTLVIPAVVVLGLSLGHRLMAPRADQRRGIARKFWAGAFPCEERDARTLTRRPGLHLPLTPRHGALSRH